MIPVGISISTNVLVGNNIGANNVKAARYYAKMCFLTALLWSFASIITALAFKNMLMNMFSSEEDVNLEISKAYGIVSIFIFFDCMQGVGTGMIRGLGRQGIASTITIIGYWVIGIPISLYGVFKMDLGIEGLWYGPTLAIVFNFSFYYMMVLKTNWNKIAEEVRLRKLKEGKD